MARYHTCLRIVGTSCGGVNDDALNSRRRIALLGGVRLRGFAEKSKLPMKVVICFALLRLNWKMI